MAAVDTWGFSDLVRGDYKRVSIRVWWGAQHSQVIENTLCSQRSIAKAIFATFKICGLQTWLRG